MSRIITSGLAGLTGSIFQSLGVGGNKTNIVLPRCKHVVLCLVDGLGALCLKDYACKAPFLSSLMSKGCGQVLSSGFPSTTAASLASLATAQDSGSHGIVGAAFNIDERQFNPLAWQFFDPQTGLLHDEAKRAEKIVTSSSAWSAAAAIGLKINAFLPASISGSTYTRVIFNGANVVPLFEPDDLIACFRTFSKGNHRTLSYIYFSELDLCGHLYGPGSDEWQDALRVIDERIQELRDCVEQDAILIVTADHGMTTIDNARTFDFDLMPDLQDGVFGICGDIRARNIYLKDPANTYFLKRWREVLGAYFEVHTREEALVRGIYGNNLASAASRRIGDLVVIAGDNAGLVRSIREPFQTSWIGHHGALSDDEQLVPLIVSTWT